MGLATKYPNPPGTRCSYGDVVFNATCRVKIACQPKFDEANRNVVSLACRMTVVGFVSPGDFLAGNTGTTNLDCGAMMLALTGDGQRLQYYGLGGGNIDVGSGAVYSPAFLGFQELNWGPKPKLLEFEVLGGSQAARFSWQVEWEMARCQGALGDIYSWTHEVSYEIDNGLTTRTIRGVATTPMRRIAAGVRDVVQNVDNLVEVFEPPLLEGWKRKTSRQLAKDRRTLAYTFTDTEIGGDNPYPPGVVEIDVKHSISSTGGTPGLLCQWIWRIGGSVTVAQDQPAQNGLLVALNVMKGRIKYFARQYKVEAGLFTVGIKDTKKKIFAIPARISITESLYNKKQTDFEFVLLVTLADAKALKEFVPVDFFAKSGLYQPTGDTWADWTDSMRDLYSARGLAQRLYNPAGFDRLVDVCDREAFFTPPNDEPTDGDDGEEWFDAEFKPGDLDGVKLDDFKDEDDDDWIDFEILTYSEAQGVVIWYESEMQIDISSGNLFHRPAAWENDLVLQKASPPIQHYDYHGKAAVLGDIAYKIPKIDNVYNSDVEQCGTARVVTYDGGFMPGLGRITITEWHIPYCSVARIDPAKGQTDTTQEAPVPPSIQYPDGLNVDDEDDDDFWD